MNGTVTRTLIAACGALLALPLVSLLGPFLG